MNTKRKLTSLILALAVIVGSIQPAADVSVVYAADGVLTLTVENKKFYDYLVKEAITFVTNNDGALVAHDDQAQTITLDMKKLKYLQIKGIDLTKDNSMEVFLRLIRECTNLESLGVRNCDLSGFDFSVLNGNENIKYLYLVSDSITKVPDVTLPNLRTLGLSKNDLSAEGACEFITEENFPGLARLWLDDCRISELGFLGGVGELTELSLADNRLTDDSMAALLEAGRTNLSNLTELGLGRDIHTWNSIEYNIYFDSSNKFTDYKNLALLPECFSKLKTLDLKCLKITSLQEFADVREDVTIYFQGNRICDFTGYHGNKNFWLNEQKISASGNFAAGREDDVPGWLEMVLHDDVLKGELKYTGCRLSDDGKKLVIQPAATKASVRVDSGKLRNSVVTIELKKIPSYTVPQDLTATVGSILADIVLPEGFAWRDATSDVGKVGTNIFQAVYTPKDTERYIVVDDIDIPVTVRKEAADATPDDPTTDKPDATPEEPTPDNPTPDNPTPDNPTPGPDNPTPGPDNPTPDNPTPEPDNPTPDNPTPEPDSPTPDIPAPIPEPDYKEPIAAPEISTPQSEPDESNLTGNQIANMKDLSILLATGKQKGKDGIKLTWRKKNGSAGYEVYWSYCGKFDYKKLKTVKGNGKRECVHKKLKRNRAYKYYIVSYTMKDGKKKYQSKSPVIHVAMKETNRTNAKRIKTNKAKVVLKVNRTFQIKSNAVLENRKKKILKHAPKFRYYVDNRDIVSVSGKGKIKAKKKGSCIVYVIANNGVTKKIKVTVI